MVFPVPYQYIYHFNCTTSGPIFRRCPQHGKPGISKEERKTTQIILEIAKKNSVYNMTWVIFPTQ